MTDFAPALGTLGGLLIGCGAGLLLLRNGRIAGISGILAQTLWPSAGEERGWRIMFLIGLPLGAAVVTVFRGPLTLEIHSDPLWLASAGILVGVGTRLGNGCTSGHGVCGIARKSPRSLGATATFLSVGAITVFVTRHLLGLGQ